MSDFLVLQTMAINMADVTTICHVKTELSNDYHIYRRNMDMISVNAEVDREDFKLVEVWFRNNRPVEKMPLFSYTSTLPGYYPSIYGTTTSTFSSSQQQAPSK